MTIFIIEVSLDGGKQWVPTSHPYYTPEKARRSLYARNKEAARWEKTSGTAKSLYRIGRKTHEAYTRHLRKAL